MDSTPIAEEYAARLAAIVANADDAIVSKTLDGRITSWNRAAERMFGYVEEEVLGKSITLIIPPDRQAEEQEILRKLRLGETIDHFETIRMTKDGRLIPISLTISPIRAADGRIVGASKIARDISERKRLEEEREELRERERAALTQARLANQAKDEFLAMLAHELRNPVGVIVNALAVLGSARPPDERERAHRLIERQTNHLARLLDDLLDVARIGGRLIDVERVPVDLRLVVEHAVEGERHRMDRKRQKLSVSLGDRPATVIGDAVRLQQIFGNLLNNASKYTPVDGSIQLSLEAAGEQAVVTVIDNGPGIPADKLEQVFDLFVQANPSLARTEGGLGIGLTLVRQLVELHGGYVHARSDGPGRGACFTVRLPLARGPAAATATLAARPTERPQRVLVVEDNADAREMLAMLLRLTGHEVIEAATGAEGIEQALRHSPTVVVMDIGLPDLNGYEVAQQLRERLPQPARLVALSGYGQPQDRARSREAGFDAHLVKPVDPAELGEVIQG